MTHTLGRGTGRTVYTRARHRSTACDDCRIEQELFKDLVGPHCPHRPSATRHSRFE